MADAFVELVGEIAKDPPALKFRLLLQRRLLRFQPQLLNGVLLEDKHRARHDADLVGVLSVGDRDGLLAAGQLIDGAGQVHQRIDHPAAGEPQEEQSDRYQRGDRRDTAPGDEERHQRNGGGQGLRPFDPVVRHQGFPVMGKAPHSEQNQDRHGSAHDSDPQQRERHRRAQKTQSQPAGETA
jgi:hypothetical protein